MEFSIKFPENEGRLILILLLLYVFTRLPLLTYLPLVKDEALYAIMIEEQARHPTLIPTFLGYSVSWKPPLFFWTYAFFPKLPLPLEATYRFPSFIFGMLSVPLLFHLLRNIGASKNISFFSCAIFLLSMPSIYPNAALLTDSLNFLLICGALYCYTSSHTGDERFLLAAFFSFSAFFVKLVIAFMIPLLAVVYSTIDRKILGKPLFILSLFAVPVASVIYLLLLEASGLASESFSEVAGHLLSPEGLEKQWYTALGSVTIFLLGAWVWFALSLIGVLKYWRERPFMTFWYALLIFPIISGNFMIWYYLPVMPAVAYFAALVLLRAGSNEKLDLFFAFFFIVILLLTLTMITFSYTTLYEAYQSEREAGLLLAGKENALIVGNYRPAVLSYKILEEYRTMGLPLDVAWVTATRSMSQEEVEEYIRYYWSEKYPVTQGSFSSFFVSNSTFRKDTGIAAFDYIATTGNYTIEIPGSIAIYNRSDIKIYKLSARDVVR